MRTLTSANLDAGTHSLHWDTRDDDGRAVGAGVYFCTTTLGAQKLAKAIAVVR